MILTKTHILRSVAALWFCAVVASCSQNELDTGPGEPLPPGQYPLTFIASVDGMTSRADGHESWIDRDEIGIRIGNYPKVGHYMLNSDGTLMNAVDALDWQTTAPTTVTAWYPYLGLDKTKTVEIDDQTDGFEPYDFLTAIAENQNYRDIVKLNFKHQMAKISCKLVKGDGISDEEFQTAKLNIAGFTKASFSNGVLTGSYKDGNENNKWITPLYDNDLDDSDYEALVVPQDMRGKDFIKIDIKVNHNGIVIDKTLIYQPSEALADLKPGTHYSYSIVVKKDRLVVHSSTTSWEDEGKWHPANPAIFSVKLMNLPKGTDLDLIFSDNVSKDDEEENLILVKGNRFSISYVVNGDNITKALNICKDSIPGGDDRDKMTREIVQDENHGYKYVFNYYLLNERVTLVYDDFLQVGDYYYEDGTWGPSIFKDVKKPIGVIFRIGAGDDDVNGNYNKDKDWIIHGYAVALHDATGGKIVWGAAKTFVTNYGGASSVPNSPYSGYNYTQLIKATGDAKGYDYAAVKAALDYGRDVAPVSSSGWYLPSIKQQRDIQYIPDRANLFIYADGEDFSHDGNYWSCVERSSTNAYAYIFDPADPTVLTVYTTKADTKKPQYVRAVLTF